MCDCPEIQVKHWEDGWEDGDYFWDGSKVCLCGMDYLVIKQLFKDGRNYVRFAMREPMPCIVWEQTSPCSDISAKIGIYEVASLHNALWLPRQDQLQEMVKTTETEPAPIVVEMLARFATWGLYVENYPFTSMEQLWLAFAMKEKHSKRWDGDKWVKASQD